MKFCICILTLLVAVGSTAVSPCITWVTVCNSDPVPPNAIMVGEQQTRFGPVAAWQEMSCIPHNNASTPFGHRDSPDNNKPWSEYCWYSATGNEPPGSRPNDANCSQIATGQVSWALVQQGVPVPYNAVRSLDLRTVMARSLASNTNFGNVIPGYATVVLGSGIMGGIYFDDFGGNVASDYEIAVCDGTTPPPTGAPTPNPIPPNTSVPFVRFGHTVPTTEAVDCVITQGNATFAWNGYQFGHFSSWVQVFQVGNGTIDIYHSVNNQRLGHLVSVERFFPPGPLVIIIKDYWPPSHESADSNVEVIAASYAPPKLGMSGVRLFNLSPDTKTAGVKRNGGILIPDKVDYTLGSPWVAVPPTSSTFSVFQGASGVSLANVTVTPPSGGAVFTLFFIGVQNSTFPQGVRTQVVSLIDAPE